jgi:hypothetical protein
MVKKISFPRLVLSDLHTFNTKLISNRWSYIGDFTSHQAASQVSPVGRVPPVHKHCLKHKVNYNLKIPIRSELEWSIELRTPSFCSAIKSTNTDKRGLQFSDRRVTDGLNLLFLIVTIIRICCGLVVTVPGYRS